MEVTTRIYEEQQLVVDVISGAVTVDELRDKFVSLFNNPDYDDSMRGLCDLRKATSRINRSDFAQLSDELDMSGEFGTARWAIVTGDPVLTAFAQIFQKRVGEGGNIQVFSTTEAAENFLGVQHMKLSGQA